MKIDFAREPARLIHLTGLGNHPNNRLGIAAAHMYPPIGPFEPQAVTPVGLCSRMGRCNPIEKRCDARPTVPRSRDGAGIFQQ